MRIPRFLLPALIFLASFASYLRGICPTFFVGDSAELSAAAHVIGVAHPSGYPLYTLVTKFFLLLPLDNIAVRANLMSAVFFSLAIILIIGIGDNLGISRSWSSVISLLIALTRVIWQEATVARVYGLNLFFILLFIYLCTRPSVNTRGFMVATFLAGLASGNHLQVVFTALPALAVIYLRTRQKLQLSHLILSFMVGIIGFSVYLELPVRSAINPPMDWENPETASHFVSALLRESYWYKSESSDPEILMQEIRHIPGLLARQLSVPIAMLAFTGFMLSPMLSRSFAFVLYSTAFFNIFLLILHGSHYDLLETDRYHIPFIVSVALGLFLIVRLFRRRRKSAFFRSISYFAILIAIGTIFIRNFSFADRSGVFIADDLGFNIERIVPYRACLFLMSDAETFSIAFRRCVYKSRTDLFLYHRTGNIFQQSKIFTGQALDNNPTRARIETAIIKKHPKRAFTTSMDNFRYMREFSAIPFAFIYQIVPDSWRFMKPITSYIYFRNRPLPETQKKNRMIELLNNAMYRRGAAEHWQFETSLKVANQIREKIKKETATKDDFDKLIALYRKARLMKSAKRVMNYKLKYFRK